MINMTNVQYGGLKLQPLQHLFIPIFNGFLIVLMSAFWGNMPQTNIFANSWSYDWHHDGWSTHCAHTFLQSMFHIKSVNIHVRKRNSEKSSDLMVLMVLFFTTTRPSVMEVSP